MTQRPPPKPPSSPQPSQPRPREIRPRRPLTTASFHGGRPPTYSDRPPPKPVTLPTKPFDWRGDVKP